VLPATKAVEEIDVDDFERWANLEGPEPDEIRALLDAVEGPGTAAEREARMQRRLDAAIAEERRKKERNQTRLRAGAGTLLVLGVAAVIVLVVRHMGAPDPVADKPTPTDHRRSREIPRKHEPGQPPPPVLEDTSEPERDDAGRARTPPRR
jgi:ferric-dicitrate binding protein FerR (iron transport regulator)